MRDSDGPGHCFFWRKSYACHIFCITFKVKAYRASFKVISLSNEFFEVYMIQYY